MQSLRRLALTWVISALTPVLAIIIFGCQRMSTATAERWAVRIGALLRGARRAAILTRAAAVIGPERLGRLGEEAFWRSHLRYVGLTFIESFRVGALSPAELRQVFEIEGEQHVQQALGLGRGILLLLPHLGHIGAATIALGSRGYDITVAGNGMDITIGTDTLPLPYVERRVARLFAHGGVRRLTLATRLPFHAARIFRGNATLALFIDFTVTRRHNASFKFGAAELVANIGPAVLALRNRPAVLYASARPMPGKPGVHRVTVRPVPFVPTGHHHADAHALTQAAVALAASDLLASPEQWWSWDWARITPLPAMAETSSELKAVAT